MYVYEQNGHTRIFFFYLNYLKVNYIYHSTPYFKINYHQPMKDFK